MISTRHAFLSLLGFGGLASLWVSPTWVHAMARGHLNPRFTFNETTRRCQDSTGREGHNLHQWTECGDISSAPRNGVGVEFEPGRFRGMIAVARNFSNARLIRSDFSYGKWDRSIFTEAQLSFTRATDSSFKETQFDRASLYSSNLARSKWNGASLVAASLRLSDLSDADLTDTNLSQADLRGANLKNALLTGAQLQGAQIDAFTQIELNCAEIQHRGLIWIGPESWACDPQPPRVLDRLSEKLQASGVRLALIRGDESEVRVYLENSLVTVPEMPILDETKEVLCAAHLTRCLRDRTQLIRSTPLRDLPPPELLQGIEFFMTSWPEAEKARAWRMVGAFRVQEQDWVEARRKDVKWMDSVRTELTHSHALRSSTFRLTVQNPIQDARRITAQATAFQNPEEKPNLDCKLSQSSLRCFFFQDFYLPPEGTVRTFERLQQSYVRSAQSQALHFSLLTGSTLRAAGIERLNAWIPIRAIQFNTVTSKARMLQEDL